MLFAPKVKIVIKKKILYIERDLSIQTMLAATLKVQITQIHLSHLGVFVIKSAFMLEFKKLQH